MTLTMLMFMLLRRHQRRGRISAVDVRTAAKISAAVLLPQMMRVMQRCLEALRVSVWCTLAAYYPPCFAVHVTAACDASRRVDSALLQRCFWRADVSV
jgi:hypothetical protein